MMKFQCTIAETHEDDAETTMFWESFQCGGQYPSDTVDVLSQYHMEHPSHYHVAGMLRRLLVRALGDRISYQTSVSIRFQISSQFLHSSDKTVSEMASHPMEIPSFSWTDVHPLKRTNELPMLGVMLGIRFLSPRTTEAKILNEVSNTSWRLVDRGYSAETLLARVFQYVSSI
jgi:imidazoleglycerol phosphate synthase glutamine amidotransferase subunit HisH